MESHLLRQFDSSKSYACGHNLFPYHSYINLTCADTYIYGPFEFATIHGRKSCNQVCQVHWDILKSRCNMFNNPIPLFDIPSYLVHVDCGAHTVYHCKDRAKDLMSWAKCLDHGPASPLYPWQKVSDSLHTVSSGGDIQIHVVLSVKFFPSINATPSSLS
jgi:hypothetical protein